MSEVIQTIELDCAPGTPRPDAYIAGVLEGTGIKVKAPQSKSFGNWEWDYSKVKPEVWAKAKPIMAKRITKLYNQGRIRYGSW